MEREKFEDSWRRAFEKAEVRPSDSVWTNIELDLERARGGELKKRLYFYKMLAAASVVFAMAIGGVGYYYSFIPKGTGNLAEQSPEAGREELIAENREREEAANSEDSGLGEKNTALPENAAVGKDSPQNSVSEDRERLLQRTDPSAQAGKRAVRQERRDDAGADVNTIPSATPMLASAGDDRAELPSYIREKETSPLFSNREVRLTFEQEQPAVDPVVAMLAKLERREREVQEKDAKDKDRSISNTENLWTSIGFAAGSFNSNQSSSPGQGGSGVASMALAAPIVDQESKATGYSYSMGVNVGARLSGRWVLQGGVNYLTHSSDYTANNVVMESGSKFQAQRFRAASTNDLVNADEREITSKLVYSAPYNVNNSMRYLSIPVQAGYLIVNRTFGLQLNAGVATDLFLQNTLRPESDQLAKTSQAAGEDSPYRAVNLSGLFGTEVSYRFGDHYRVSLNPGLRYPFNTIYKSELGVQSTPLTFDVGLRFRYIFN